MISYCKHCMVPCEDSVCPACGNEELVVILPEDPCFVTELQMLWAGVLEDVLDQRGIPHMKKPVFGAGLMRTLGSFNERYRFYVPYEHLNAARELAAELFSRNEEDGFDLFASEMDDEKGDKTMSMMDQDILKVLYTEEEIAQRINTLGAELYENLQGKDPLFVSVLRGAFIFMADIVRACQVKCDVEFIAVSSYGNATSSSGAVQITHDIQQDITGRDLVIIEDILDSGNTLSFLKQYFLTKGASSVTICTLLDKPSRRTKAITADYIGFTVPDEFVVGYGLDYAQKYRNLPYIGVLKPEVYGG